MVTKVDYVFWIMLCDGDFREEDVKEKKFQTHGSKWVSSVLEAVLQMICTNVL